MISGWPQTRRLPGGLGFRLGFLLIVALVPLGVIAALQADALFDQARARSELALLGETRSAVAAEVRVIQKAEGAAAALAAAMPNVLNSTEACRAMMRQVVAETPVFSFAGFVRADGMLDCSTAEGPVDLSGASGLQQGLSNPTPQIGINHAGRISGTSIVYAMHPVRDAEGALLGFTSVSVPHRALVAAPNETDGEAPLFVVTFDHDGQIMTSSVGFERVEEFLPQGVSLASLADRRAHTFTASSELLEEQTYSVVPVIPGRLHALGGWRESAVQVLSPSSLLALAALPILMGAVSLLVALMAADRLVTRHVRKLTGAITSFAGGARTVGNLDLSRAPSELREAGEAFERMTESILQDEAYLEDMVHQKEVLLREVHHRVKNNLQLIASIMSMQAREAQSPEAVRLLRRLRERVMSLATVHRDLYQTSGEADVRADELLEDIVRQIVNLGSGGERRFAVRTSIDDIRLVPDQAVPLALLLTEALTNAMKYAESEGGTGVGPARLWVELRRDGDTHAVLVVENSIGNGSAPREEEPGNGLGERLIAAFALQLGGEVERVVTEEIFRISVRFAVNPLVGAEARYAVAS